MTRNRLLTFIKNIPSRLLLRHAASLLYGQLYFLLVYKQPLASLKGYGLFLRALPHALHQRRHLMSKRFITDEVLDSMLSTELGEPSLGEIIFTRFSGFASWR